MFTRAFVIAALLLSSPAVALTFTANAYSPPLPPAVFEGGLVTSSDEQVLFGCSDVLNISFVASTPGSTAVSASPTVISTTFNDMYSLSIAAASGSTSVAVWAACVVVSPTIRIYEYQNATGWVIDDVDVPNGYGCAIAEGPGGKWILGTLTPPVKD